MKNLTRMMADISRCSDAGIRPYALFLFVMSAFCNAPSAAAQTINNWTGLSSGNWNVAGNWSDNSVPTSATDTVIDNVTANTPLISSTANSNNASIGFSNGSSASLTADGTLAVWNLSGSLSVGGEGDGLLTTVNGAMVATGGLAAIGHQATGVGTASVSGTGSRWSVGSNLYIGDAGNGLLNISNNGEVITGAFGFIGNSAGAVGVVNVSNAGRLLTVSELPVGVLGNGTLTVSTNGTVTNSSIVLAKQFGSTGKVNIGADAGSAPVAPGVLNTASVSFGRGNGSLNFNHDDNSGNYRFTPLIGAGNGQVNIYNGSTTLHQNNLYGGQTRVYGGTLVAGNTSGSATGASAVQVDAAGTLRGNGFITGAVTVDGSLTPGDVSPGVLTLGQLTLNAGSTTLFRLNDPDGDTTTFADFVNNDRVDVTGNLTLGGTLSATISAAGVYRLFNYGGSLSGSFVAENYVSGLPDFVINNASVDTSINHQVNLTVTEAGQSLQFWDGSHTSASGQPLGAGGDGVWNSANTNWVDILGTSSGNWSNTVGVFAGNAGTVTLAGNQSFASLQFLTDGYTLLATGAGDGVLVIGQSEGGTLNIERNVSAVINAPIVDGAGGKLTIVGGGTAILGGVNSYSGGTLVVSSRVQANADSAFGAPGSGVALDSAVIRLGSSFDLGPSRVISLLHAGGGIDTNGFNSTLASPVQGEGAFHKLGNGTLTMTSAATSYSGDTVITAGTLALGGAGQIAQSASVQVDSGAVFDIAASSSAQNIQSLNGAGQVALGAQNLSLTNADGLFSGVISGDGGFGVHGGTETLSNSNIYRGLTSVDNGSTLALIDHGAISQSAGVSIGASGRFDISQAANGAAIKNLAGGGLVELGGQTLTLTSASGGYAGSITGSGGLVVQGGAQTLSGNNSYTGITAINSGATLNLSGNGRLRLSQSVQNNGTFDISATTDGTTIKSLGGNGLVNLGGQTLMINNAVDTFSGQISGSGGLSITGGEVLLGGINTYSGPTTIGPDRINRTFGTLGAAAANTFSPQSSFIVQTGGTLKLYAFDQTVASLSNAGLIQFDDDPHTILTVTGNYTGNNGVIRLNTALGDSSSPTDKLIVRGDTAGATSLTVVNVNGDGGLTAGNGIRVIQVGGASNGTFALSNRLAAGAYEYLLYQGGTGADAGDGNWYLRSTIDPPPGTMPPEPSVPNYRVEVPLDSMLPVLLSRFGVAMLGTYHERYGADALSSVCQTQAGLPGCKDSKGYWLRAFMTSGNSQHGGSTLNADVRDFQSHGPSYDFDLSGFQTGFDVARVDHADYSQDVLGLFAGAGTADGSAQAVFGGVAGSASLDAFSFGAYWTHRGRSGWYVDTVLQGTRYTPVETSSVLRERLKTDGWGMIVSAEGGYPFALGNNGWVLEPQAQLIYQYLTLKDSADDFAAINFDNTHEWFGRLGARLTKTWQLEHGELVNTWARINWWKNFGSDTGTTFASVNGADPVTFNHALSDSWAQFDLGISAQMVKNMSVFVSGEYSIPLGSSRGHAVGGWVGMKIVW